MNIQWKIVMGNDYFPCFKFCKLQTLRRGRQTLVGSKSRRSPQDRPLRSADLAGKELSAFGTW